MRCARRKHPYSVIPMTHDDICDFSQMSDSVPHLSKIRWRNVKWLRYLRVEPAQIEVYVKDSFGDGDFHQLTRKTRKAQPDVLTMTFRPKYHAHLPITDAKKADLMSLCKNGTIPTQYHDYYKTLPAGKQKVDRLAEPNQSESSDDE